MEWLTDPNIWIALLTLTALEIVLGIEIINLRVRRKQASEPVHLRDPSSDAEAPGQPAGPQAPEGRLDSDREP